MDKSGTDEAEYSRKVANFIRSLINARSLRLECARVLHESLLVPVLLYGRGILHEVYILSGKILILGHEF